MPFAVLEAPTGYGKTASGALVFKEVEEYGLASGYLHVLPLRAIVDDLYSKLLECRLPGIDSSWLRSHGIGYQMMDYIEGREADKSPYFLREIIATTFDSFIYNLARLPIAELGRRARHYEIPRSSILTSLIVFDEAHLYGGDLGLRDVKMFSVLLSSVRALARLGVPTIVESATLPSSVTSSLLNAMNSRTKAHFRLSKSDGSWDREYAELHEQITWVTEQIGYDEVLERAFEHYESGEKVLVIFNNPGNAIDFYLKAIKRYFDEGRLALLHGRLISGDRSKAYRKLKRLYDSKDGIMLVSTQVIEAGVDISFDVLFTEAAPPTVLTQRAGRIARYGGPLTARVYVFEVGERGGGVYDEEVVEETIEALKRKQVEWRLPEDRDEMISYRNLTEAIYSKFPQFRSMANGDIKLEKAITHPMITNQHLNKLLVAYCGLVREPLLTGYVARQDEVSGVDELDPSRFIVLGKELARRLALNDLLHMDDGMVIALRRRPEGGFEPRKLNPSIFNNCKKLFEYASDTILLVRDSAYREGLGIVL